MKELIDDDFYKILNTEYDELLLDYVLLSFEEDYEGDKSHKKAVKTAISVLNSRIRVGNSLNHPQFYVDENKMICTKCCIADFFYEGSNGWYLPSEDINPKELPEHMNYWVSFFKPPYGIPYKEEDFRRINEILFPSLNRSHLEIYIWNDDFSNYFDDGKEWWGTALWSIYDKSNNKFIIIGASLTD